MRRIGEEEQEGWRSKGKGKYVNGEIEKGSGKGEGRGT